MEWIGLVKGVYNGKGILKNKIVTAATKEDAKIKLLIKAVENLSPLEDVEIIAVMSLDDYKQDQVKDSENLSSSAK